MPGGAITLDIVPVYAAVLALLLLTLAELQGTARCAAFLVLLLLLSRRAAHAWGVSHGPDALQFRVSGTVGTFSTLLLSALVLLVV